jgi:aryl-alcohol dehydrogenase-like predicted oxidoreductase
MYGEGMAERVLGKFLSSGQRGRVSVATKIGYPAQRLGELFPPWMYLAKAGHAVWRRLGATRGSRRYRTLSRPDVEASLVRSLRNLRTDTVDLLFIHDPSPVDVSAITELAEWLLRQKENGRARYLGLAGNAAACVTVSQRVPGVFDVLQVEDSIHARAADAVLHAGMPLQITFGYLRSSRLGLEPFHATDDSRNILLAALARNARGVVLVSSRKPSRVAALAGCLTG